MARKGSVVSFGNASGAVEPIRLASLTAKNVRVCRPSLMSYLVEKDEWDGYAGLLWEALDGGMQVGVHGVYRLEDVKRAHVVSTSAP